MLRMCGLLIVAMAVAAAAPAAPAAAPAALAAEGAPAPAQTPAVVPPNLQALEQKMAQIRFNTARISLRFVFGELGSPAGGAELGSDVNKAKSFAISAAGAIRFSPPAAAFTSTVEGLGLPFLTKTSKERTIGKTIYTYKPSVARFDGGRPWVRSRQKPAPKPDSDSARLSAVVESLAPTFSGSSRGDSTGWFTKLIEDLNGAVSIQEVGPVTVDGQQATEFTASLSLAKLLAGKLSPKQLASMKPSEATMELEAFLAPNGLPVRTTSIVGNRIEGIGIEDDILALEIPVVVHAPPASKTIGEARLRKLEKKRAKRAKKKDRSALH